MSNGKRPIASIGLRRKEGDAWKSYSVIVVWGTDYEGLYNANLDKGTDKRPAMGLTDAFRAFAGGASLEIRTNQPPAPDRASSNSDFGGGDDIPF
jgi:hypothetical protein